LGWSSCVWSRAARGVACPPEVPCIRCSPSLVAHSSRDLVGASGTLQACPTT
jgi:hypothetical protein